MYIEILFGIQALNKAKKKLKSLNNFLLSSKNNCRLMIVKVLVNYAKIAQVMIIYKFSSILKIIANGYIFAFAYDTSVD